MPSDDLRKRIEAMNKQPLRHVPEPGRDESPDIKALRRKLVKQTGMAGKTAPSSTPQAGATYSRDVPASAMPRPAPAASTRGRDFGPAVSLEEAVKGITAPAPEGPGYYLIEKPAHELTLDASDLHRHFVRMTDHPTSAAMERLCHACKCDHVAPEEMLFVDLETTGLSVTPLFLIGTMECTADGFRFRQYFARDYSEEISVLTAFSDRLRDAQVLVTFNGKSFDIPFLRNRAVAHRISPPRSHSHIDLLHEARRVYRGKLPNCKLQTLEQLVCGRVREDDIPGSEIPAAYHDYVRTGNANKIGVILLHNLYDLLTMADLMHRMWGAG